MIVVTGAAGFIGSNLVRALNARGLVDILAVDDLTAAKFPNVRDLKVACWACPAQLHDEGFVRLHAVDEADVIFHLGGMVDTTCDDLGLLYRANVAPAIALAYMLDAGRLVYASSAAVHGNGDGPLNPYGWSKAQLDFEVCDYYQVQRACGLRFFNVYGRGESHKGPMASMPYRVWRSIRDHGIIELYEEPEEQPFRRDFVHVDDVVAVLLHFGLDDDKEGPCRTFDVGTGDPRTFGDMAMLVDGHVPPRWPAECRRIPFPAALVGKYQTLTWADLGPLRAAGYSQPFLSLEEGLARSVPQWEQGL